MGKCLKCGGRGYKEYFCRKNVRLMQKTCKYCNGTTERKESNIFEDLKDILNKF